MTEKFISVVGNKQMNPFRGDLSISPCITQACGAGGGMTPMITTYPVSVLKEKWFIELLRGHYMKYKTNTLVIDYYAPKCVDHEFVKNYGGKDYKIVHNPDSSNTVEQLPGLTLSSFGDWGSIFFPMANTESKTVFFEMMEKDLIQVIEVKFNDKVLYKNASQEKTKGLNYKSLKSLLDKNGICLEDNSKKTIIHLPKSAEGKVLRIRKLTPRECFRLQDVPEEKIDAMMGVDEKGKRKISNSQCYKLAGNSITVAPMAMILGNLLYGSEPRVGEQLELFK